MRIEIDNLSEELFRKIQRIEIFPKTKRAIVKIGKKEIKLEGRIDTDYSQLMEERYLQFWFRESK